MERKQNKKKKRKIDEGIRFKFSAYFAGKKIKYKNVKTLSWIITNIMNTLK